VVERLPHNPNVKGSRPVVAISNLENCHSGELPFDQLSWRLIVRSPLTRTLSGEANLIRTSPVLNGH
jgi:hypothetical protein